MAFQTTIPLDKLTASKTNVRKTASSPASVKSMADSIRAKGLLQNLIVSSAGDGTFSVEGGERRRNALMLLVKSGEIAADFSVQCLELEDGDDPVEISLAENVIRSNMHPADEFEAYAQMLADGRSVSEVSSRFGVAEAFVRQRMKLSKLSPKLIDAYRRDEMTLDVLTAFTVTSDHAAQERVFAETSGWSRQPHNIRSQLTRGSVSSNDRLAVFVGLDEYEQAGGMVTRDLFSTEVYLDDRELLERLAEQRLAAKADEIKAEGWGWAESAISVDWQTLRGFGRIRGEPVPVTNEEEEEIQTIHAKIEQFREHGADELSSEEEADWDVLEERLEELTTPRHQFPPEQMAQAGAMVGIDYRGGFDINLGLTRDKNPAADAGGEQACETVTEKPISSALIEELSAQRTAALAIELARNPHVALVATVHKLLLDTGFVVDSGSCLDLHGRPVSLPSSLADPDACKPLTALDAASLPLKEQLPGDATALWHWLMEQSDPQLMKLLAHASARCVNVVEKKNDYSGGCAGHDRLLAETLDLDMRNWWEPTAQNYFDRTPKAHIERVVRQALGEEVAATLSGMKKREAAAEAERLLCDAKWLPEQLDGGRMAAADDDAAFRIAAE